MSSSAGSRTAAAAAAAAATAAAAVAAAAQAAMAALPEPRIYDYSDEDTDLVLQGACWKVDMGALDADAAEYMLLTEEELAAYEKFSGMKFSAMDVASSAGAAAKRPRTAKPRVKLTLEELMKVRWAKFANLKYVDASPRAEEEYVASSGTKIFCTWCNGNITVATSAGVSTSGNIGVHEKQPLHAQKAAFDAENRARDEFAVHHRLGQDPDMVAKSKRLEGDIKAVAAAMAVAEGIPPFMMPRIFAGKIAEAVNVLGALKPPQTLGSSHGGTENDLAKAKVLLLELAKAKLQSKPDMKAAITCDGGQRRGGERNKIMIIYLMSSELELPIMIDVVLPESTSADGQPLAYDHAACAIDVKTALQIMDFNIKNITQLMGDNVNFNTALARAIGVERGNCIPHAAALLVKTARSLPLFESVVITGGGLIFAGGSNKRAAAMKALGLEPVKHVPYLNRFASTLEVAAEVRQNYPQCLNFYTTSPLLPLDEGVAGGGDDGDEEDESVGGAADRNRAQKVRDAYMQSSGDAAIVMLHLVDLMYGGLPAIIKETSSEGEVSPSLIERLERQRTVLVMQAGNPKALVEQACARAQEALALDKPWSASRIAMFAGTFAAKAGAACQACVELFDKHIKPAVALLRRRFLYTISVKPATSAELKAAGDYTNTFFGCMPSSWGPSFWVEWDQYCDAWSSVPDRDTTISSAFWRASATRWPTLAPIARFWLEFYTSSITCERGIAKMRVFDTLDRQAMKLETFKREMFLRCNKWLLDELMTATLMEYKAHTDEAKKRGAAIAAAAAAAAAPRRAAAASSGGGGGSAAAASVIELDD